MAETGDGGFAVGGKALAAALVVAALWVAWGLAAHAGFQPAHLLRVAAPVVALVIGGAFTRLVAQARSRVDEANASSTAAARRCSWASRWWRRRSSPGCWCRRRSPRR